MRFLTWALHAPARQKPGVRKIFAASAPTLVCSAGLWLLFYPMLSSGFALMQSDHGDTRFLNYVLEHGYRWLAGDPHHAALWSPPVFFPQQGTLSYSESLLGVQPVYGVWRAIGFEPDTAMQLLMLLSSVLNFAAAYLLLRREFATTVAAGCFGAFLFAFASARGARTGHQHLLPHFFTALALLAALRVFRRLRQTPGNPNVTLWLCVFFASVVAQIYAGIYLGWFLCVSLLIGAFWGLAVREFREKSTRLLALHWPTLTTLCLASLLALSPLVTHYRQAATDVGFRSFTEVTAMLPRLQSWLYLGRSNLSYGWLDSFRAFGGLPLAWEHEIGLGLVTTATVLFGLWHGRRDPRVRFLTLVSATIVLAVTLYPGEFTPWRVAYFVLPGARAMRGMTRIALLLLIPASIGAALAVDRLLNESHRFRLLAVSVVVALSLMEQVRWQPSFDKRANRQRIAEVAALVPPGCPAFYYSARHAPQGSSTISSMQCGRA
jgi:hypothetical protein